MVLGTILNLIVSWVTNKLFIDKLVSRDYDVLKCYQQRSAAMRHKNTDIFIERSKENGEEMVALT